MINGLEYLQISKENSNSHRRCSVKKGVLRNFAEFPGKHLCQRLFANKVESARPETLSKKSLQYRCFPVNFAKFLRTAFLQNTFTRLLLRKENYRAIWMKYQPLISLRVRVYSPGDIGEYGFTLSHAINLICVFQLKNLYTTLSHFMPLVYFNIPGKHQKTRKCQKHLAF